MGEDILDRVPPPATAREAYGTDPNQFGDIRLPAGPGPFPVAVCLHGGFWRAKYDLDHFGHVAAALAAEGVASWNVEFRRTGNPGGGWPGTLLDVGAAADHVRVMARKYPLDLSHILSIGHSAGGHLALWLAGRHRIKPDSPLHVSEPLSLAGTVSLAGVLDLAETEKLALSENATALLMGGSPGTVPERYAAASPAELLPLGVPQLVAHGLGDDTVPYHVSADYADRARAAGDSVKLLTLPHAGHFELIDPLTSEWAEIQRQILPLLQP